MSDIPDWATTRALDLAKLDGIGRGQGYGDGRYYSDMLTAFARYIAEHEEPPVDPLEEKLEKEANRFMRVDQPTRYIVLAALRRGIEIGKSDA